MNKTTNETDFLPPYADADAPAEAGREEFHITDEAGANWLLSKLGNIEAEKQRVTAQAALIISQLDADADGLRWKYESELQEYVRRHLAANGNRRRSLTLLQGTCAFRTCPPSLKISDPAAALVHVIAIGADAIKRSINLDAEKYRALAEAALQNGELLPGVETTPARESFRVTFGKSE